MVAQSGAGACDVSGVTIRVALPGPDGQPPATGAVVVQNATYPSTQTSTTVATVPWTVALNPGVTVAKARVDLVGTLQDVLKTPVVISKELSLNIAAPKLGFTVAAEPATGTAPLDVTYRFALTNQGVPADPLTSVALAHPNCDPVYGGGDSDADGAIDAAETWRYACTHRFAAPGDFTSTSNATAISASDGRGVTATPVNTLVRAVAGEPLGALTLTTVASPATGVAPLGVTYTYTVRNTGSGAVRDVTVVDGGCPLVMTAEGATPLAPGQTRTFTCSRLFATVGTFSASAVASGIDEFTLRRVSSAEITTDVATTDAPAPSPVATTSPGPDPTPAATASPTPRSTTRPSTRVSFTAAGRFARPCRGRVALTLKAGTKTITRKTAKPDRNCRYRVRFDVARSRLGSATRVTVTARLGRSTKTQRFSVPR